MEESEMPTTKSCRPLSRAGRLHRERLPAALQFSDKALVVRKRVEQKTCRRDEPRVINRKLAAQIGKYGGIFAWLRLLWHCIEDVNGMEVSERTAQRVADVMRG
jgi:hypothetical protein